MLSGDVFNRQYGYLANIRRRWHLGVGIILLITSLITGLVVENERQIPGAGPRSYYNLAYSILWAGGEVNLQDVYIYAYIAGNYPHVFGDIEIRRWLEMVGDELVIKEKMNRKPLPKELFVAKYTKYANPVRLGRKLVNIINTRQGYALPDDQMRELLKKLNERG